MNADTIIHNAKITTLDRSNPVASAAAIKDGRFLAVGSDREVLALADGRTKIIDLKGRSVLPGLFDNHTHVVRGGLNFNMELRWDGVRSLADAMDMLKRQVAITPAPQWVRVVGGFTEHQFAEKRLPTIEEINALNAFIKLQRAGESVSARVHAVLPEGLTVTQFGVLEALLHLGPMSQKELAQKMLRSSPNMCAVLENLERDGHVARVRDEADRRVQRVSLTQKGRRTIERVFPGHAARIAKLLSTLSAREQEELSRLCKKLGLGAKTQGGRDDE